MNTNSLSRRLDRMQNGFLKSVSSLLISESKCLVSMATGTGKTILAGKLIKQYFPKQRIAWISQTTELVEQTKNELAQFVGKDNVGLFQDKIKDRTQRVIVFSIQTLALEINLHSFDPKAFDLIIVDEAHHARARTWEKAINYFKARKLALTATPERTDGLCLSEIFGDKFIHLSYEQAKRENLIAHEVYRVILTNSRLNQINTNGTDYSPKDLDKLVVSKNRNQIIVESYKKYMRQFANQMGLKSKAICFCISRAHAKRMQKLFQKAGISSQSMFGYRGGHYEDKQISRSKYMKERKEIFEKFKNTNEIEILCSVNVLNEGKNVPDVTGILLCRPTMSKIIYTQQIGRGSRRIEGKKEKFMILDYVDLMNQKYPPVTMWKLLKNRGKISEIIPEYWTGKDPIVLDKIVDYLSPNFVPDFIWTKQKIQEQIISFFREKGKINYDDLIPLKTGLPAATTIKRFYGSVKDCMKELRIPWRKQNRLPKEEVRKQILDFFKAKGRIRIVDLGSKNNLPSQRLVQKYWGSWTRFVIENKIAEHGYHESLKLARLSRRK